jgi:hypothetical protein
MALRVYSADAGGFQLLDERDVEIGWVRDRMVGFRGFTNELEARQATLVTYEALGQWLARQRGLTPQAAAVDGTTLLGVDEWGRISIGAEEIGALHRPGARSPGGPDGFAIELHLPRNINEGAAIGAASVMHHALERWRSAEGQQEHAMAGA